ncbi:MAG: endonuclease/exonuclease/phosphatase family protein [Spirochaetales bacterium]|nr:endonuclease/exonuclease/phosphatase family protein [Spirochaetales bacterium]
MKTIKIIITIIASVVAAFILFLSFFTLTEYRPDEITELIPRNGIRAESSAPGGLNLLSWNLGYCGLDSETDFFMEGGSQKGRNSIDAHREALDDIIGFISKQEPDICFLQEVDTKSHRSYKIDQSYVLASSFGDYEQYYGKNYSCAFVPMPIQAPIGKVESGILTMSRFSINESSRHSLPGSYSWPVKVFHLKRCAVVSILPSAVSGKFWYLINIHLSAYGNGSMRAQQLEYLRTFMTERYNEGHYVVIGGDWNSMFPGVTMDDFGDYTTPEEYLFWVQKIPENWTPSNWQWCYDNNVPTSRSLEQPFKEGENFTTLIDGFLVSPNLKVRDVKAYNLKFKSSDHNPTTITVSIRD